MADPKPPGDGLDPLVEKIARLDKRVRDLESPSGTQKFGAVSGIEETLAYLASLVTLADNGASALNTGTVANDNVFHWFATSPDTRVDNLQVPTGKLMVTASCGEASIIPGGSFVIAAVTYSVRDANGVAIPGAALGDNRGRRYTNVREGAGLTTNQQLVEIPDMDAYPGPYVVRAFFGMWVSNLNTTACSTIFSDPSLVVQVIGDGV